MGGVKRKSTGGPVKKESKYKIPRRFDCPVCDAKASIAVKVLTHEGHKEALIKCRNCGLGAQDGRRPMLWLEKAVDAFFAFREELMEKDRAYLEQQGLSIGNITSAAAVAATAAPSRFGTTAVGAAAAPAVKNLAELERTSARRVAYGGAAGGGVSGSRRRPRDAYEDDVAETAAEHFAPRVEVHSEDDEYGEMFS